MASNSYLDNTGVLHLWSKIKTNFAPKATTLAGYGITDAKIANGTITLGGNSITPLTSHQSVRSAGASLSPGDTDVTIATIGATPIKLSLDSIGYYNAIRVSGSSGVELYSADEAGGNRFNIFAGNGIDIRDCGLNEDGIYIDSTFDPDTKVSKSGDTMTGELIVKNHEITLKYQSADLTLADNGVSANIWRYCRWHDTNSKYSGYVGNCVYKDGKVRTTLLTRNYTNSTTYVDNALTLDVTKDGTRAVYVSEAAPWRSAIGTVFSNISYTKGSTTATLNIQLCARYDKIGIINFDGQLNSVATWTDYTILTISGVTVAAKAEAIGMHNDGTAFLIQMNTNGTLQIRPLNNSSTDRSIRGQIIFKLS